MPNRSTSTAKLSRARAKGPASGLYLSTIFVLGASACGLSSDCDHEIVGRNVNSDGRGQLLVLKVDCGATTRANLHFSVERNAERSQFDRSAVLNTLVMPEIDWIEGKPVLRGVDCSQVFNWDPEVISIEGCSTS